MNAAPDSPSDTLPATKTSLRKPTWQGLLHAPYMSAHEENGPSPGDITALLRDVAEGSETAEAELFQAIYGELHRRAGALMRNQPKEHTLQATALVGEVYAKLFGAVASNWADRQHFMLTASRAMRQILVDHARKKSANKRQGNHVPLEDEFIVAEFENRAIDIEALHRALEKLASINPVMARGVELRFFGGIPVEECARILDLSVRSFHRRWSMTRAWL